MIPITLDKSFICGAGSVLGGLGIMWYSLYGNERAKKPIELLSSNVCEYGVKRGWRLPTAQELTLFTGTGIYIFGVLKLGKKYRGQ